MTLQHCPQAGPRSETATVRGGGGGGGAGWPSPLASSHAFTSPSATALSYRVVTGPLELANAPAAATSAVQGQAGTSLPSGASAPTVGARVASDTVAAAVQTGSSCLRQVWSQ